MNVLYRRTCFEGFFWKSEIVLAVNGTKVDLTPRCRPTKAPFSCQSKTPTPGRGTISNLNCGKQKSNLIPRLVRPPAGGRSKGWSPAGLFWGGSHCGSSYRSSYQCAVTAPDHNLPTCPICVSDLPQPMFNFSE